MKHNSPVKNTYQNDDVRFEPVSSERELLVELLLRRIAELETEIAARRLSEHLVR